MGKTIIRNKKSTNARQRRIMEDLAIDEMDLAFCDLVAAGWNERLAAYYAYSLTSDSDSSIDTFIRNQRQYHPGIAQYMRMTEDAKTEEQRMLQKKAAQMMQAGMPARQAAEDDYDLRTKTGMLDYLVDLSSTPGLDVKTKTDLAKQISDLMQFKKEEIKEEDNRISFFLPVSCRYCDRCESCELKDFLKKNAEKFGNLKVVKKGLCFSVE